MLIDMLEALLATSCFLMWLQEDMRRRLNEVAVTDALTDVLNRHGLMPPLEQALAASRRSGRPLSIVLCDLDHFKRVNDTHGHDVGDRVLKRFAGRASTLLRRGDRLGRWGGEEFLLLLPDTALSEAAAIADRVRIACADRASTPADLPVVSLSAGVACTEAGASDRLDLLLQQADRRLYLAKVRRDCIVAHDVSVADERRRELRPQPLAFVRPA